MGRERDLEGKEITIFTDFKFKDYEGIPEEDIDFPTNKELIRKELKRLQAQIDELRGV